ncbi:TonB-dependent receptor [Alteraurantiacibacter buctensis]|uniref:TonB-dependent receptor n=1 Tax=Alteraurantiacibacter buctensis TaxID=1503981 RepID=A0A844Z122_9SPHN|nr:TonB-dependent receptor [Alteraurantiacibacter buctensis]MXO73048.1 TonB-dependent receptor [Alteraurantiacibacter buctensis]
MKFSLLAASASAAIASTILVATPSIAQSAPAADDGDEDDGQIIVTAQRREQSVLEVPVSVTVTSQEALERQQVNQISDLSRVAPALEVQQAPNLGTGGGGQIRGVGTTTFQIGAVGSVGVVVDEVSQGNANITSLFDVERVEVLKGPQGTLFGLTTSAGVINIATRRPEYGVFGGRFRTELSDAGTLGSEYGRQLVQGVVNLPIADNAAMRVSGNYSGTQGIDRNTLTGELDKHHSWGLRGRLLWEPSDVVTVNLIGEYSDSVDERGNDFFKIYIANPAIATVLAACGITASRANRDYCTNSPGHAENELLAGSLQVDYDLGGAVLTSVTALRSQDQGPNSLNIFRLDTYPTRIFSGPGFSGVDLFTQELRLASDSSSPLEYTVGLFYSDQDTVNNPSPFSIKVTLPNGAVITPVSNNGRLTTVDDSSYAVFGQATYHLSDSLRVLAGARYTNEEVNVFTDTLTGATGSSGVTIHNFSWKTGLQYEVSPSTFLYGTVTRGYKGPQIALADPSNPTAVTTIIKEEIPTSFEIGLKAGVGRGMLFEANAFSTRVRNYQGQVCNTTQTGGLQCVPQNIGTVTSRGFELSFGGRVAQGWMLNTGLIYNDVDYPAGLVGSDGTIIGGTQLANAPEWKATASTEYFTPVTDAMDFFISGDMVFKSSFKVAQSTDPNVLYPSHFTLGGRVGIRGSDSGWSLSAFVRNLTNNHEPVFALINFPDGNIGSYGQILTTTGFRQVGLALDYEF